MAFNTFKCNYLLPLHFKGLITTEFIKYWLTLGQGLLSVFVVVVVYIFYRH